MRLTLFGTLLLVAGIIAFSFIQANAEVVYLDGHSINHHSDYLVVIEKE